MKSKKIVAQCEKSALIAYMDSEGPGKSACFHNQIRVFAAHL